MPTTHWLQLKLDSSLFIARNCFPMSDVAHGLCFMSGGSTCMYELCFAMVFKDPTYAGKVKH